MREIVPEVALIATLTRPPSRSGDELTALPARVRFVEVRADQVGSVDPGVLRRHFNGKLVYSLRSRREGGSFDGELAARHERLIAAAERYDRVDLEAERDLVPRVLERIPAERRVISWHGTAADRWDYRGRLGVLDRAAAWLYRMVPTVTRTAEALAALEFLAELGRRDVTAFAAGPAGTWTSLLAPRLGAPVAFGAVELREPDAGEISAAQLVADYGLPSLKPVRELFGIVGSVVSRSLSPRLHNAAYRAASVPALYLPFSAERFEDLWSDRVRARLAALGMPLKGLTVISPHKEAALAAAAVASPVARRAGAANLLVQRGRSWLATTTDAEGVLLPLRARRVDVARRRVAVVGCGGAGRAAAAAFDGAGAEVTLVNRGLERGRFAASLLGLPFAPLADFAVGDYAIVVNATPCAGHDGEFPFDVRGLARGAIVVDLVVGAAPTPLVRAAEALGHTVIDGREVLLVEARRQFRLMTGRHMAAEAARKLLDGHGNERADEAAERRQAIA
ncbi:type I 3-dehydroquinate dehydratase [Sorangium atrum]|uniref:Type I 3-dehydroquinate dehydratase n=1 Tax=Sorangium atrum TaxID=2995308 RepID=A0ABT5C8E8_9BACT|nr:type I 3-dehydroquinate dehydratase [Sorangium aterium]MDC0682706.1 type I 3-dehydroquinate dehydratase [Sorangium aterium]